MHNWKQALARERTPLTELIKKIDQGAMQIALIVNSDRSLLGTVTDGDIRRGLLKGISLKESASKVMNREPVTAREGTRPEEILSMMKEKQIHQIPMIDGRGRVVGLKLLDDLMQIEEKENWIVLMAGGMGRRLSPLTDHCPKPLIHVGTKPLLETILENFKMCGFKNFYISVNFQQEMIRNYFGSGDRWGLKINYIKETKELGTAGSLSLLPSKPRTPLIVMNGDVLTNIRFDQLLKFHSENHAAATMAVREYDFQVPYGVIGVGGHKILKIDEKPVQKFLVNAGVYVLDPKTLSYIPKNKFFHMTDLFETLLKKNKTTSAFPVREYWLDIGHIDDLKRANGEYLSVFGKQ
jgi:dTDP-glucose pyrophosphorylase